MSHYKLYGFWRSTATWRVRIGLSHKGLAYDYQPINLREGEGEQHSEAYRGMNPMRQVPLLEFREEGRLVRISQSVAILEMLEEKHLEPRLLPQDIVLRARARQLAEMINSGIQPLQNTGVQHWVREALGGDDEAWIRHWVTRGLAALEAIVGESAGRFCIGDFVTLPDLFVVPQLAFARRFGIPLDAFPTLTRIDAACSELPAFQEAHADRQPDAPPP